MRFFLSGFGSYPRLARKNELKARGTLLMALPDKRQLKFNIHKDAKTLMEVIEKRFGGNKETKKVQKTLLKKQYENFTGLSSESLDQIHNRLQKLISQLEILGESLNLEANRPTSIGFDMSKVECYNCHRKGHFARECRSPKDTRRTVAAEPQRRNVPVENSTSNALVLQCDGMGSYDWSFQAKEEPTNYALMAFTSLISSGSNNETDESLPVSPTYDRYQSSNGYHDVPPPYTGTFMPPKPDLVFHNAPNVNETVHTAFNVELSPTKPDKDLSHTHRPLAPIIEDWVSDSEDDSEPEIPQNAYSFVQPNKQVKTPRPSIKPVETFIPAMSSGKEESKPRIDKKFLNTIQIDHDDEDGDDDEDDLKHVPSSKIYQVSSKIDSDDDRCISILIRKNLVTKEIPTIPFLDSDSDEEEIKETYETIMDK
uniref:Ribonuclease H-like domain-containing protein n=1 Tax=Tanacetum cinerariifolium TaxID=118510 RepID=A0A699JEK0_TANCI|nr:ribonuclease H-like domain-containing protein [Tanacetum cinerariifolium]